MFYSNQANLLMKKHHLNNYWRVEKISFSFPLPIPSLVILWGLLLHLLQFYQRCEPMILKLWAKSKFILSQPRYYNLLTDKKDKKIHVFEILIY